MTKADARPATVVLLEFYGGRPEHSFQALAGRLPPDLVQMWDAVPEPGAGSTTLDEHAEGLILEGSAALRDRVIVVGSCFGAPLAHACGALLAGQFARDAATLSVDPAEVTDDALAQEINALAARVSAPPYAPGVDQPDWRAAATDYLCLWATRKALSDADDPEEAAEIGRLVAEHYERWLHYLDMCRMAHEVRGAASYVAVSQSAGLPSDAAGLLDLGPFADTAGLLSGPGLARWLTRYALGEAA